MATHRPNPDDLLRAVQETTKGRGRLKLFLGASAGVGKTYAMLSAAHEQRDRGVDVVIGYAETHGRKETQDLIDGLEAIPQVTIDYRGSQLRELDVDAILRRQPQLALIDELAHTNAPGSRHTKRWQDIQEVLDAGIDVYTAVNIQHLESLNDVVAQVAGIRVNETVPDSFLDQADEVELIDIPPAELQQRLREGKVYVPERVEHALEGFFKAPTLTALRELALRRTADTVDAEMQRLRTQLGAQGPWAAKERVVVCIAPNRMASRVVRAAARIGAASHAELIAVHVESDRQASRPPEDHMAVQEALELAVQLGMEVATLNGHDIVAEVMYFAQRRNATLVVVGKPIRARWRELLFGSVVDELVRASGDIDVQVITGSVSEPKPTPIRRSGGKVVSPLGLARVGLATILATSLGFALHQGFGVANVAMVYLLGVATVSTLCTRWESILASLLSVLSLNFFFVDPRYTLAFHDGRYFLVFLVMLAVGLVISTLTHRLRSQVTATSERERRTSSLYSLSRQLAQGRGKREMARVAASEMRQVFDGDVAIYLAERGSLHLLAPSESGFEGAPNEFAVATWVAEHASQAGLGTDTLPGVSALYLPLTGSAGTVGVLAFRPSREVGDFSKRQLLETFGNALGLALERAVLAKASNDARVLAESERIRSTLLSSISHDLRTPLTSITGAASSIVSGSPNQKELAATIYSESVRLNHQIQNLLDMTRLQSGGVQLDRKWHAVEELAASALRHAKPSLGERSVKMQIPVGLPLLLVDGLLIEKALVNLLENAGRHTGQTDEVAVTASVEGNHLTIIVRDNGPGIQATELDALFRPELRTAGGGFGLGLPVVKAIMDLHGGDVEVGGASPTGAVFKLRIPLPDRQPEAPHE